MHDYNQAASILGGGDNSRDYGDMLQKAAAQQAAAMNSPAAQQPHLMAISERLSMLLKRITEAGYIARDNMDRILGATPENDAKSNVSVPIGENAISEIRSRISEIEDSMALLERQARRLNSL